jgi:hypothetical protein
MSTTKSRLHALTLRYLAPAKLVVAVNPAHQRTVTKFCEAHRRVDLNVDLAAKYEDDDNLNAAHRRHLRDEEKWFDVASELESELPKRELENIWKKLPELVFAEDVA